MDPTSIRTAINFQRISFYLCNGLGSFMVIRNFVKLHRYSKAYKMAFQSLKKYRNNIDWIDNLRNKGMKETVFLQMVFVNIPRNYFKNIEDRSKYMTDRAKFYEQLQCQSDLQGSVRFKGKDYPITLKMNNASIGFQLASNARIFDAKNVYFHRNQTISVLGEMSYNNKKQIVMKTQLMGLDSIQIVKYYQLVMFANIISTFYWGILLGVGISFGIRLNELNVAELLSKGKDVILGRFFQNDCGQIDKI